MKGNYSWKGGTIYVNPDGEIEKVVGLDGNEIPGAVEPPKENRKSLVFFDEEERCVYGSNGKCYCT